MKVVHEMKHFRIVEVNVPLERVITDKISNFAQLFVIVDVSVTEDMSEMNILVNVFCQQIARKVHINTFIYKIILNDNNFHTFT